VLEHLLYACCLENAPYEAADEAFAALVHNFFDWNEVRVSTARELSEVLTRLPDPLAAANRVKGVLQSLFEATYSFEIEALRKQNLGAATEKLAKFGGTTKFAVAYVVQAALGGHSVPIDTGAAQVLWIADVITEAEATEQVVHGMERAIPKNKGIEFGSLLHQVGAEFIANPYGPKIREIILEINPDATQRLPKRRPKKEPAREPQVAPPVSKEDARVKPAKTPAQPPAEAGKRGARHREAASPPPAAAAAAGPAAAHDADKKAADAKRRVKKAAEPAPAETAKKGTAGRAKRKPR
jgi:hypothetical protein